ncbi:hypothetical protein KAR91_32630 [Candidatus Pacearchaeota archaeon]|nr:hypothetical protein [Candidatus Pacearchaeota archaeon]
MIKKIAFGDSEEAFVESRLTSGLNILYSNENNRGKTLVMQGLMYSIGYGSIFPSSFDYKEKYFYSEIEIGNNRYEFLRKKNSVVIKADGSIQIFNSISELKYFIDKFIFPIPRIQKDNRTMAVDLSLFYELFFVGQDNRNPSSLISKGQFNKSDFKNMVYYLAGMPSEGMSLESIKEIKDKIARLKIELKEARKKISLLKENPDIAEVYSRSYDSEKVQQKIKVVNGINSLISKLKRSRQREINRKSKLEHLISELNSLNRNLNEGSVKCGECGSQNIVYTNNDLTFEVSNADIRNRILHSISDNIKQKNEIIYEYSSEINELQDSLNREISDTPPNFQQLVIYQEQAVSDKDYDKEAFLIIQHIESLKSQLSSDVNITEEIKSNRKSFDEDLLEAMRNLYKTIDPNGNLEFEDIFSKRDSTFSGSESQEFYFCKILALNNILNHDFPIMVDSFRDGELSSKKEDGMLNIYEKMNKQIILTSTLKDEEYREDKYKSSVKINAIDYSTHEDSKILSADMASEFTDLVSHFEGLLM